jgi:hypothetical protein
MIEESPMDEVTDLIASVEMHRKEIERESGLDASRSYALKRLQDALQQEQERAQQENGNPVRVATAEALANEIKRVGSLSRGSGQRQHQGQGGGGNGGRPQQQQPRNFRQDQQRRPKSRGRRPMGRPTGR